MLSVLTGHFYKPGAALGDLMDTLAESSQWPYPGGAGIILKLQT